MLPINHFQVTIKKIMKLTTRESLDIVSSYPTKIQQFSTKNQNQNQRKPFSFIKFWHCFINKIILFSIKRGLHNKHTTLIETQTEK